MRRKKDLEETILEKKTAAEVDKEDQRII